MAHDNVTPNVSSVNSAGETFNHEVLAADNTTLTAFVLLFGVASNGVNTITYNGVAMNSAATPVEYNYTVNRYFNLAVYTLDGVSAGVQEFAVTFTGTAAANACILISRTEHNNGVGSTAGSGTGNTNNPTVTFTTDAATGTILAAAMMLGADSDPFAPDGTETERADGDTGGGSTSTDIGFTVLELPATGGSDTLSSTATVSDHWAILAIELDAEAGGAGTDNLTPNDLATGAPALTAAAIGQTHVLTGSDLATQSPVLDSPALGQVHVLTGNDLTTGPPTLDIPEIGQIHVLTGDDLIVGTPVLDSPALGQIHVLTAVDLSAGTPLLETPLLGQIHALTGSDLTAGVPTLGAPELADVGVLVLAVYTVSLLANPLPGSNAFCNALPNQNLFANGTPAASMKANITPAVSLESNPSLTEEVYSG